MEGSGHSPLGRWAMTIASAVACLGHCQVGLAQTPSPDRTQFTLVVSPQQQSYPGSSSTQSKEARQDPALVQARRLGWRSCFTAIRRDCAVCPNATGTDADPRDASILPHADGVAAADRTSPGHARNAPGRSGSVLLPRVSSGAEQLLSTSIRVAVWHVPSRNALWNPTACHALCHALRHAAGDAARYACRHADGNALRDDAHGTHWRPAAGATARWSWCLHQPVGFGSNLSIVKPRTSSRPRTPGIWHRATWRVHDARRSDADREYPGDSVGDPICPTRRGVATIQSVAAAPLIAPQSSVTYPAPPPPQAQPQSVPTAPAAPTPSPQWQPHKCHFWCRHN